MTNNKNEKKCINDSGKNILLPLLFIPCILVYKMLDNDIWFLMNSGRYVVNYGIPYIEPFTIHQNMEFVMQQWLTSVIYWTIYNKFGSAGIYSLIMIVNGLIVIIIYKISMLISNNNFFISYTITLVFSVLIRFFMISRPIIFTIFLISLELFLLETYIKYDIKKYLLILPLISLLMINLHAAMWPMLFVILTPYIIDSFTIKYKSIIKQEYGTKHLIITTLFMIATAFINPYGIKSVTYLFRSYGYPEISKTIIEMQPPNINDADGLIVFLFIFIIILIYCFYRKGKTKVRYLFLTIGTCVMTLSSYRSFPFLIICAIFPLAYYLKDLKINVNSNEPTKKTLRLRKFLLSAIIIFTIFAFFIIKSSENDNVYANLNESINYILNNENLNNMILYTGYGEGALTEFKGLKTYIDPRAEVFVKKNNKKDDIMKEYINLQGGYIYYKDVIDKYNFTHLLVSKNDILYTYLPYDNNYEVIYSNESYKIFRKIYNYKK